MFNNLSSQVTKWLTAFFIFYSCGGLNAQTGVDLSDFNKKGKAKVATTGNLVNVSWPASDSTQGRVVLDMGGESALINALQIIKGRQVNTVTSNVDPSFILTIGKRDLVSQNGWNIFFDRVPLKPFTVHPVVISKNSIAVRSSGSRTIITIGKLSAAHFSGDLEITLYNGSALLNIAAVLTTGQDSTAILYDAGLTAPKNPWDNLAWMNVDDQPVRTQTSEVDSAVTHQVKYRTIVGETKTGSVAIFPAPHQYFYPLDEAFNLNFTWSGKNYRNVFSNYGIGIRQDLYGDKRFVPWFNAPPGTRQRLNFYCLLSVKQGAETLTEIKRFTNADVYPKLDKFKRFSSHFHNEFVMNVIMAGKKVPDTPSFVKVFKSMGVDIVHLGEFHYTAHPKGPDEQRLKELDELFKMCARYSDDGFLLLPGEEPNEFLGGHWLQFFPKPVYWIMSRAKDVPFISQHPDYGKVYRVGSKDEMLKLLELENGLAWTAHPRTKGSTGYPDKYKSEPFFTSPHFMGAAWKPIPADLSVDRLGIRVLDLMDDMNNWGLRKKVIAEADLFTIEPANEMYAHMNVNYLQMEEMPDYAGGWKPVIDVLNRGRFFSTTGEVLIPAFSVGGAISGDTLQLSTAKSQTVSFRAKWTFPLEFALIVSGDAAPNPAKPPAHHPPK
ncbi:MAG: hypothetical protein EOO04_30715 [Chitinophagaceae bacterium]|nr:MAG: hypothetical protein EOO04_30715 [Chitinophagaceae bacterium]